MTRRRSPTFEELTASFLHLQRSDNTRAAYRSDLGGFAAWCAGDGREPMDVDAADVERYRDDCEAAGSSASTVSRRLSALSSFFEHAVDAGALVSSPVQLVSRPVTAASPTADLDEAAVESFIVASAAMGAKTVALVNLLLYDGLRLGEILEADAADVTGTDVTGTTLTVTRREAPADIDLDERSASALAVYLGRRTGGPLLEGAAGQRLSRFGADYLIKQASEAAGLGRAVSANTLRRSHIAASHASGETVEAIQERLGHADRRTTERHLGHDDEG